MDRKPGNNSSTNNSLSSEEQLLQKSLQKHLNSQVDNLNFNVTTRLSAARHRALSSDSDNLSKNRTRNNPLSWKNAIGGIAALFIAAVVGLQFYSSGTSLPNEPAGQIAQEVLMEDLNLLSSSDDIEFYQSVDFLEWMETYSG